MQIMLTCPCGVEVSVEDPNVSLAEIMGVFTAVHPHSEFRAEEAQRARQAHLYQSPDLRSL